MKSLVMWLAMCGLLLWGYGRIEDIGSMAEVVDLGHTKQIETAGHSPDQNAGACGR